MIKNSSIGIRGICPDGRISQDNLQAKALWQWIEEFQASGSCGAKVGSLWCLWFAMLHTVLAALRPEVLLRKNLIFTAWISIGIRWGSRMKFPLGEPFLLASVAMTCEWLVSCYNHAITLL